MLAPALEAPLGALLSAPVVGAGAIADAVVVGAGPAGSLAARALAARGASVLLVERAAFPRWKVCGACLNAGAQAALARAGLADLPRRLGAVPLERLRLAARAGSATLALRGSVALSREALDAALAKAAVEAGAELLTGARASRAEAADGLEEVVLAHAGATSRARARLIVDATGLSGGLVSGGPAAERAPMERTEGSRVGLGARF
ncbi:MAG TPA: FAD-dependent oxidoreductase, partial [Longimicrobiales bacterium]|nr:FAD-dependent oxidoreductase [Longimicrobiales bacterium]